MNILCRIQRLKKLLKNSTNTSSARIKPNVPWRLPCETAGGDSRFRHRFGMRVGYVGRDVESMVRDLVELTVNQGKIRAQEAVQDKAVHIAEERMLDLLLPKSGGREQRKAEEGKESQIELVTATDLINLHFR